MEKYYEIIIIGGVTLAYALNFGLSEDAATSFVTLAWRGKHKWEMMREDFPRWVYNNLHESFCQTQRRLVDAK